MIEVSLVLPLFQKHTRLSWLFKITTTQILIIFGMNEKDNIVIFNVLLVWLHFELIVKRQLEYSLLNVFVDDLEPPANGKVYISTWADLLTLVISFQMIIITNVMKVPYLWVLNILLAYILFKVHFSEELLVDEHSLKAVRYVALCLAVVYSKGRVDADLIAFFFVCSI